MAAGVDVAPQRGGVPHAGGEQRGHVGHGVVGLEEGGDVGEVAVGSAVGLVEAVLGELDLQGDGEGRGGGGSFVADIISSQLLSCNVDALDSSPSGGKGDTHLLSQEVLLQVNPLPSFLLSSLTHLVRIPIMPSLSCHNLTVA